jgi:hypothetical protein
MNKNEAFEMIETAKQRELTDAEVEQLGEWAKASLAEETPQPTTEGGMQHVLAEWITAFTKGTRPTQFFSVNFKKVNRSVMPSVVAIFSKS